MFFVLCCSLLNYETCPLNTMNSFVCSQWKSENLMFCFVAFFVFVFCCWFDGCFYAHKMYIRVLSRMHRSQCACGRMINKQMTGTSNDSFSTVLLNPSTSMALNEPYWPIVCRRGFLIKFAVVHFHGIVSFLFDARLCVFFDTKNS